MIVNSELQTIELCCACVFEFFMFRFPFATYSIGAVRSGSEALSLPYSVLFRLLGLTCDLELTDMLCIECKS